MNWEWKRVAAWRRRASLGAVALVAVAVVAAAMSAAAAPLGRSSPCRAPLAKQARGSAAVTRLGPRLAEAARTSGFSAAKLRSLLADDPTLWVDRCGHAFYVEPAVRRAPAVAARPAAAGDVPVASAPVSLLHSRPGASRVIFLDFDGEVLAGTEWNTYFGLGPTYAASGFDTDGSPSTFSPSEEAVVQGVWKRVAEDYAPFDVDVTTEDPGPAAIDRSGPDDLFFGTKALITNDATMSAKCSCGGIAYIGVFDLTSSHQLYQPALVFTGGVGTGAKNIAEAVSHEVGHNLGLNHDGVTGGASYYDGQGSWAPIMGVGYYRPVTQWSKGEYTGANNLEDDLAVIQSHGAPLRPDDYPDTAAAAFAIGTGAPPAVNGVISTAADVDWFSFSGSGPTTVSVAPAPVSPDLDIRIDLYTSAGVPVASADPAAATAGVDVATGLSASVSLDLPSPGRYLVKVDGVGFGSAASTGYSDYASLGQYTLSLATGPLTAPGAPTGVSATAANARASVSFSPPASDGGSAIASYTVTASPGGVTASGATSPIVVPGLTNGTTYTFTVKARTAGGTGPESAPSSGVTASAAGLYWANHGGDTIGQASLAGTGASQGFVAGAGSPDEVAVDAQHVYWTSSSGNTIGRANLDGTAPSQGFIAGAGGPDGIAVDGEHVYWANDATNTIGRASLDGTGVEQSFIAGAGGPSGVAVDGRHVYWANVATGSIGRANLDGTGVDQRFITGADGPRGVAVDGRHIYWANVATGTIGRASLDGTGVSESFIAGASGPVGVAVDGQHVYWTSASGDAIGRASLDGTGVDQSFVAGASAPYGLAVLTAPGAPTLPGAPTAVSAVAAAGQATVSFTAGASGGAANSFTVTASPGGATASDTASPIVVPGLANGTAYTFTVTATNAAGTGAASAPSSPVTPLSVPGAPTSVVVTAGDGQLTVSFAPPSSNGGAAIGSYTVTVSPGGQTVTRYAGPVFVGGLVNGTSYTVTVAATNAVGVGPPSPPSAAVVPSAAGGRPAPGAPGQQPRVLPPDPPRGGTRPPGPGR